ncbi:MAG: type I-E CRISPR-associated protein Cse1/CasA [Acidimicrobiales bacterium]
MTATFNLLTEPWVPCLDLDGKSQTLNLRDTLVQADGLTELQGDPPATAALLRLLIAIVHRVLDGPKTSDAWASAWAPGRFDEQALDGYLQHWRDRFDLFDAHQPFFQALLPVFPEDAFRPPTLLDPASARGHNATLFDHSMDDEQIPIPAAVAARRLIALQSFTAGGLMSGEAGSRTSGKAGLLAGAWTYFVTGPTLFQTLLLNTPLYDPGAERPFATASADAPVWERPPPSSAETRVPAGWLDLLTYPSRRVHLVADETPNGEVAVSKVALTDGDRTGESWTARGRDQNLAFRESTQGWVPIKPSEDRDLWRDADVLLRSQPDTYERPRIIEHVGSMVVAGAIPPAVRLGLDAYGLATNQAKYLFWRHQRLPLQSRLFHLGIEGETLSNALAGADTVARALQLGVAELAGRPISPDLDKDEKKRRRMWAGRAMADFWGHLGPEFDQFLTDLAAGDQALVGWSKSLEQAVRRVWRAWSNSLPDSTSGFHRAANAGRHYGAAIAHARQLREGSA